MDEWQRREQIQAAALGQETAKRNAKAEADNRERMIAIDGRIAEIDAELKDKFPDYAALASPAPLSVEDVQAQLGTDEALVLFLDTPERQNTPEETFVWVVTKTDARWVRSELGQAGLAREVQALRCGLDYTSWQQPGCKELTGQDYASSDYYHRKLPPFDAARAHRLYKAMLGGAEDLLKDKKHLILVPSGALTQLPPQVLVTKLPEGVKAGPKSREVARIGVAFQALNAVAQQAAQLTEGEGTLVVRVVPKGAAEAAGIKENDIILSVATWISAVWRSW